MRCCYESKDGQFLFSKVYLVILALWNLKFRKQSLFDGGCSRIDDMFAT